MTIRELKTLIEQNEIKFNLLVFEVSKEESSDFIASQYIDIIGKKTNLPVVYTDKLEYGAFNVTNAITVLVVDELTQVCPVDEMNFTIIKCRKCSVNYSENVVTKIPCLESWQIADYVHSTVAGVRPDYLNALIASNKSIFKLESECSKLRVFGEGARDSAYEKLSEQGLLSTFHTSDNVYTFVDALILKDFKQVGVIYKNRDKIDIEGMGIITLLHNKVLNMLKIQMSKSPTPESTGIDKKVYYAISRYVGCCSNNRLIKMLRYITLLDYRVKSGELLVDYLLDDIIINLLSIED